MSVDAEYMMPLEGIRVADLTDCKGAYCAKLLGELGAEVVRIEAGQSGSAFPEGPFFENIRDREHSIRQWYCNSGKRPVKLELATGKHRQSFLQLIESCDILIESCPYGFLEDAGLDYSALQRVNPALCMVSISGFGRKGTHSKYTATDIVASASGGQMYVCGRPGRPPLKPYGNQSYYLVSLLGAIGALLVLRERDQCGSGQHVDLSLQEAVASSLEHVLVQYLYDGITPQRQGSLQWNCSSSLFPCRDGYVLITFNREWESLVELLAQQGKAADLMHPAWKDESFRRQHIDNIEEVITMWTCQQDNSNVFELGQSMRFPWAILNGISETLLNEQLQSRGYFVSARHPLAGKEFKAPRPVIHFEGAPPYCWKKLPLPEEDSAKMGAIVPETPGSWMGAGVNRDPSLPLAGVRILDFTWMLAGPYATRMLADFGAEVIKVQSKITATGAENNDSGYFAAWNRNKLGITLDMSRPEARELALKLVSKCDVVMENFTPRVMDNWDMSYEKLKKVKPDLVMVSLSGFGHAGPWRDFAALGPTVQALSGLTALTAYDKGVPDGIGMAYADHISGLYAALAVLAALRRRDVTGKGAYADISEFEAACSLLGPEFMDCSISGRNANPAGNRDETQAAAPQGCYRCKGEDRWCVISVCSQDEWKALCIAMGRSELAEMFAALQSRLDNHDEIDELIEKWTANHTADQVMNMLQEAGVAAAVVNNAGDLVNDPALKERGFFIELEHPKLGRITTDANPIRLSLTPAEYRKASPLLGENNRQVFINMLGMDEEMFIQYVDRGIIG